MKKLKKLFAIFFLILITGFAVAQSPQAFNYQAVARNAVGHVLPDQAVGVRVTLHQNSEAGDVVYSETFTTTTNEFGLMTLSIGNGTPITGDFSTIIWSDYEYWMQVEMDMNGGSSYSNMGTSKLLSVPYAMYARTSEPSTIGIIPEASFNAGYSYQPSTTGVVEWSGPRAILTITSPLQKVLVTANVVMGASATAGTGLYLYTAFGLTSETTPTVFGAGSYGLSCPANTRLTYSTTGIISGLTPGVYYFGAAVQVSTLNWNNNEYGSVTAIIINP